MSVVEQDGLRARKDKNTRLEYKTLHFFLAALNTVQDFISVNFAL